MCNPEMLHMIIMSLHDCICLPRDFVVVEGEVGNEMFFIRAGVCKVTKAKGATPGDSS